MNNHTDISIAKSIMGNNFIGEDELKLFNLKQLKLDDIPQKIPYSKEEITKRKNDYLLIYGASSFLDGEPITIRNIKNAVCNKNATPTFYNQDWYNKENFIDAQLEGGWFFIRKKVYENSRAVDSEKLMRDYVFPTAIKCVYSFWVAWYCRDMKLWYEDFVWCSDLDHNGDRIYVGKYHDVDGVNADGFSIHRHLALRNCYACID